MKAICLMKGNYSDWSYGVNTVLVREEPFNEKELWSAYLKYKLNFLTEHMRKFDFHISAPKYYEYLKTLGFIEIDFVCSNKDTP